MLWKDGTETNQWYEERKKGVRWIQRKPETVSRWKEVGEGRTNRERARGEVVKRRGDK